MELKSYPENEAAELSRQQPCSYSTTEQQQIAKPLVSSLSEASMLVVVRRFSALHQPQCLGLNLEAGNGRRQSLQLSQQHSLDY